MAHRVLASLIAVTMIGACATTSSSSYPNMDVAEKTAADVAVHLDHLTDTQVVDCLDINTVMASLLMNSTQDLGVPRDIMLEIQGLNLLGWIAARDRRVTNGATKEDVMQAGTFMAKFEALDDDESREFLNEERIKCDAYLDKARDDNLAEIRAAKEAGSGAELARSIEYGPAVTRAHKVIYQQTTQI